MYRAHHVERKAWWYDNGRLGRFNLSGSLGTCYTATDVETAVREKVRDEVIASGVVSRAFADTFRVSAVTAPLQHKCASVSSKRAARYNVVRALVTMDDYAIPQLWAAQLNDASFEGVYYGSAYTTGAPSAFALFGSAGGRDSSFTAVPHLEGPAACEAAGMTVVGPPPLTVLTLI